MRNYDLFVVGISLAEQGGESATGGTPACVEVEDDGFLRPREVRHGDFDGGIVISLTACDELRAEKIDEGGSRGLVVHFDLFVCLFDGLFF